MTCEELNARLADLVDGNLSEEAAAVLRDHADDCSCCSELVRTYGVTVELSRELGAQPVPPRVAEAFERMLAALS